MPKILGVHSNVQIQSARLNTLDASSPGSALAICWFSGSQVLSGNGVFSIANDSTLGTRITILKDCKVEALWTGAFVNAQYCGFSVNSTQIGTALDSQTDPAVRKGMQLFAAGNSSSTPTMTAYLRAGDVLRPHNGATGSRTGVAANFYLEITAIAVTI